MNKIRSLGFTLVELLIVVAIIGLLISVVLGALNTARDKGTNSMIRSNLKSAHAQAAMFHDEAGRTFFVNVGSNACVNDSNGTPKGVAEMRASADAVNGPGIVDCNNNANNWAMAAQLVGDNSGDYYCTDSTGYAGEMVGTVGVEFADDALTCN